MTEHAKQLHDLVSHAPANHDLSGAVCSMLLEAPKAEQADLFYRYLLEYKYTHTAKSLTPEPFFSAEDEAQYAAPCKKLMKQWVTELSEGNPSEEAFHSALWQKIRDLQNPTLRAMMVAVCAENPALPRLPSASVEDEAVTSDEGFRLAVESMDPIPVALVGHLMNRPRETVSQDAAALLPLLERCGTRQEKIALLTLMFLAVHEELKLAEFRRMLAEAADRAMDDLIREATEEWED